MPSVLESAPFVRARRARLACGILAVVSLAGFLASANRILVVSYDNFVLGFSGGCAVVGNDPNARAFGPGRGAPRGLATIAGLTWESGDIAAWRPFHARTGNASRLKFPLWQPMLGFAIVAALSHGYLRGGRHADRASCTRCGYDLSRAPRSAERRCPECGEVDTRPEPSRSSGELIQEPRAPSVR